MSLAPQLKYSLDSLKERAKDAVWALTSCLCHPAAKVKINGRTCPLPIHARLVSSADTSGS